jgi:hypothetical protein
MSTAGQGLLSERSHATETGEDLRQRILAERRARWGAGQRKGRYKPPAAPVPPSGRKLPRGWAWATIGELSLAVDYGSSAKTSDDEGGVPVLRMGNIRDGALSLGELKYLPVDHPEFPELLLHDGDLLFNRTNSPELVGKSAVYRCGLPAYSFASYLIRVRLAVGVVPEYIAYCLNSPDGREWVRSVVSQQVGQANVNGSKLKALTVPLPPTSEQHAIVARLTTSIDRIAEAERRLLAAKQRVSELLDRILNQAVADASSAPQETIECLAERVTSGSRDWKPYYNAGSGVFVLTQNVRMRRLDIDEPFHVDPPADDPARARSAVERDDILITIVGANCGNLARVPQPMPDHFVCQSLALVRLKNPALSSWVELFMAAPAGGQRHFENCYYGQGRPHLSFADIKRMRVPIPAKEVRDRAVALVERQSRAAQAMTDALDSALRRSPDMRRALLQRELRGEGTQEAPGAALQGQPETDPSSVVLVEV